MANRNDLSRQIRRRNERVMGKLVVHAARERRARAEALATRAVNPARNRNRRPGAIRSLIATIGTIAGSLRRNR